MTIEKTCKTCRFFKIFYNDETECWYWHYHNDIQPDDECCTAYEVGEDKTNTAREK